MLTSDVAFVRPLIDRLLIPISRLGESEIDNRLSWRGPLRGYTHPSARADTI